MKYVIVLLDGMADYPIPQFNYNTPLEYAKTPVMDMMFQKGTGGTVKNIPENLPADSAVANLNVMGYDPQIYFTGRSPIEAAGMGVNLKDTDTSARCNLVTLCDAPAFEDKIMVDYCSDEITTEEAKILINYLNENMDYKDMRLFPGISYRHLLVWGNAPGNMVFTQPHDITGKKITQYLPSEPTALEFMKHSYELLKNHPVNIKRVQNGLKPANSVWFWGAGVKTVLPRFDVKFGVKAAVISAVDLIQGIAVCAGMEVIKVKGATGNFHTDYKGKADACIDALDKGYDFVYIHIEAPDECGHRNEIENKAKSIEYIDSLIIGPVIQDLKKYPDYKIMALADHPTPLSLKTHTRDAVPFVIFTKNDNNNNRKAFSEKSAAETGLVFNWGHELARYFLDMI